MSNTSSTTEYKIFNLVQISCMKVVMSHHDIYKKGEYLFDF